MAERPIDSPHAQKCYRLIVLGQKQLPEIDESARKSWGFVEEVCRKAEEL
jgi:hypothetical protein